MRTISHLFTLSSNMYKKKTVPIYEASMADARLYQAKTLLYYMNSIRRLLNSVFAEN